MTPLHPHGIFDRRKGAKSGRTPQALAIIQRMLNKGLIEPHEDGYRITDKGLEVARQFREAA